MQNHNTVGPIIYIEENLESITHIVKNLESSIRELFEGKERQIQDLQDQLSDLRDELSVHG